ncbi:MAG: hypothetical protein RL754_565 [Bacteroidota bacterium]|jgi:UDP-2,3-diacylglucosamine pyrophosphatase LpxH
MSKRAMKVCVISDTHLGTFGSHAKELDQYLRSINPETLVLNGDIIDIWNFRKKYFPKSHIKVVRTLLKMAANGTKVHYILGNHDEALRRFRGFNMGNIELSNKVVLKLDGKKAWIFHGDVFDTSIQQAKFIAKLGGWGYDALIWLNRTINLVREKRGKEKYSFSKKIKESVKKAVKFINDFESIAAELAIEQGYEYIICGHIHQPQDRVIKTKQGSTRYLNSGDWVESLTALEYDNKEWTLYSHADRHEVVVEEESDDYNNIGAEALLNEIVRKAV